MLKTTQSAFNAWVMCPKPNPQARLRLFCFPYAGAGSQIFRTWAQSLPASLEVCPIELPGRGTRIMEAPYSQLDPLVETLASVLLPHLDKPFAFFGHSMGALLSFELVRRLRKKSSLLPLHLFVSGRQAPQIPDSNPPIHALPEPAFLEELRRYNGTPQAVLENAELMHLLLPILRADFAAIETYVYASEPPLECPITAFGGFQDPEASCDELAAWCEQTSAAFSLQMFPGDHFFLHSAQSQLLQFLSQELHKLADLGCC
ncbi:MAG: thioesterase II family protein [Microcoleus vaginatus WJT46-NPBG5]|jgi:medium-chain acyl-[acyl-carrier-protein] hydrolase|nr:thioesterase II family protein [Microcoleus vaginatus WJT46-NPBG5]